MDKCFTIFWDYNKLRKIFKEHLIVVAVDFLAFVQDNSLTHTERSCCSIFLSGCNRVEAPTFRFAASFATF